MLSMGLLFIAISIIEFFIVFGSFESPKLTWLFIIAMPLVTGGSICLKYGYMGAVIRYTSSEVAPVAKDTVNYMIDGTKDSIAGVIQEVRGEKFNTCPKCNKKNPHTAKFCDNCGHSLSKECPNCHTLNDIQSKYCNNCGHSLT